MSTEWKLTLKVQSDSKDNINSLSAALITDCEVNQNDDSFSIEIIEYKAKDLRAMWNTRVRGLIAVNSIMSVIDGFENSEDSSTSTN